MSVESCISIYTLRKLDNSLLEYKKNILKHFYDNFLNDPKMNYNDFENQFLENENTIIKKKYNSKKCDAKIWKKGTYRQCENHKKHGNFCSKHCEQRNYGTIN